MQRYSECDPPTRQRHFDYINVRWGQLYELDKDWSEKSLKFLFLTNSGGAIATLSFLGAARDLTGHGTKIALFLFITGIICVGISTAITHHHLNSLFNKYKADVAKFFDDEITWSDLNDQDSARSKPSVLYYIFPYLSFAFFLSGIASGACALL